MVEEALPDLPVTFHTVNASNLADLKILNQILFPVKYQVTPATCFVSSVLFYYSSFGYSEICRLTTQPCRTLGSSCILESVTVRVSVRLRALHIPRGLALLPHSM